MLDSYGRITAPEFPPGLEWLNSSRPLFLRELRGRIVLLDFWTFCCINCMHIIPDLKRLEKKYAQELVVIGVHSAKFTTEQETENIRQAILRYEIEHAVVNDRDMRIWNAYAARAWPTLFLIDPQGKIVAQHAGEGIFEPFDQAIAQVIADFDAKGLLERTPLTLALERERVPESLLSFPGKVLADSNSGNLFIADSNHNRIVVASLEDGAVREVVGSGEVGLGDGSFEEAAFNHPQGMAFDGEDLYVADTENHAIRRVNFASRQVTTIAGNGEQAEFLSQGGVGTQARLNSPWDLVLIGNNLYFAMAGAHQIWVMDFATEEVRPYVGSGREARSDGSLAQAALAQPSGITSDGYRLYFADSESSSIRWADLPPGQEVGTIVGLDLFVFGDRDGKKGQVRLQHPLGVAFDQGLLYVADTYNNKIKVLDPNKGTAKTLFGTGKTGLRDGKEPLFDEPGGLSAVDGRLYIADTNNHVVRVADLATPEVSTFKFKDMEKLRVRMKPRVETKPAIELVPQRVKAGQVTLNLGLELPKDYKLTPDAPSKVIVSVEDRGSVHLPSDSHSLTVDSPQFPVAIPLQVQEGEGKITAEIVVYYCQTAKEGLCFFKNARFVLPVEVQNGAGEDQITVSYSVAEK